MAGDSDDEDPWGFVAPRRPAAPRPDAAPRPTTPPGPGTAPGPDTAPGPGTEPAPAAQAEDPWSFLTPAASSGDSRPDGAAPQRAARPVRPRGEIRQAPDSVRSDRARGELRDVVDGPTLRHRAWPMALSLALVSFAGFVTEMVGASQMIALAGPQSLLVMYPLGGLGLLLLALLQFRFVDQQARLPMLRAVTLGYAVVFIVAITLILAGIVPVVATGLAWILADQLNFLVPVLVWALAADEFKVAEGRRIFGWIVSWTYAGQLLGLAVATVSPWVLTSIGVPLPLLLVVDPLICLFLALWLPHVMRGSSAARGLARGENLRSSFASALEFINGVPIWRTLLAASVLTAVAGMTVHLSFMAGAGLVLGADAAALQTVLAGVSLVAFVLCWLIQRFAAERIQERLGIAGTLLVLPIGAVIAGLLLALGVVGTSLVVMAVGVSFWRIPRWTVDENARRAALALVPDERRARVAFFVDLGPIAVGLVLSGLVALGLLAGVYWLPPLLAALIAASALPLGIRVVRGWDDSLINWRLRRRKQNRWLDLPD